MTNRLYTAKEIARFLNVSPSFVYEHAEELGATRDGRRLFFDLGRVRAASRKHGDRSTH